jgi:hypothetical protein
MEMNANHGATESQLDTYKLGESSAWTLLDNDETILDQPFADVGLGCGIVKSCAWLTSCPVRRGDT